MCDKCRAIDEKEGSPSGSIITFVNKVADEFPNHMISTLAYEYGRRRHLQYGHAKCQHYALQYEARRDILSPKPLIPIAEAW
jgi:hypothetical protein